MNVVQTGTTYRIYEDDLKTYRRLPAQMYGVVFNKASGFMLSKHDDVEIGEKVYGVHEEKVAKVMNAFAASSRNLGVILSGDKGIGKSIFAKMLSIQAIRNDIPVIIVDTYIPGIANFISSIRQEVVVLFDEFDKTFCGMEKNTANDPQTEMLSLFDGIACGKKLFVVTCNELRHLNDYLVNRPGRFHYHLRFEYPSDAEIEEYLRDKIPESAFGQIPEVVAFAKKVSLNYDCLRAISFELCRGFAFKDAIRDLNIVNLERKSYSVAVYFDDGSVAQNKLRLDLFDDEVVINFTHGNYCIDCSFPSAKLTYSSAHFGASYVEGECIRVDTNQVWSDKEEEWIENSRKISRILIRSELDRGIHYRV